MNIRLNLIIRLNRRSDTPFGFDTRTLSSSSICRLGELPLANSIEKRETRKNLKCKTKRELF